MKKKKHLIYKEIIFNNDCKMSNCQKSYLKKVCFFYSKCKLY